MQKISNEEYNNLVALNYSGLKELLKSPLHYQTYLKHGRKQTEAMIFGEAMHTALLEPHLFSQKFYTAPTCEDPREDGLPKKNTKEGKDLWNKITTEAQGKMVISNHQATHIKIMTDKLYSKRTTRELLNGGLSEQALIGEIGGIKVKARADYIHPEKGFILDLKTTSETASPDRFKYKIYTLGYHLQAAFYLKVANLEGCYRDFYITAIETFPPFECKTYQLDFGALELGNTLVNKAITRYKECLEKNSWPGYEDNVEFVGIPGYAFEGEPNEDE